MEVAKQQSDQNKDALRASIREQLKRTVAGKATLYQILTALGIQVIIRLWIDPQFNNGLPCALKCILAYNNDI